MDLRINIFAPLQFERTVTLAVQVVLVDVRVLVAVLDHLQVAGQRGDRQIVQLLRRRGAGLLLGPREVRLQRVNVVLEIPDRSDEARNDVVRRVHVLVECCVLKCTERWGVASCYRFRTF